LVSEVPLGARGPQTPPCCATGWALEPADIRSLKDGYDENVFGMFLDLQLTAIT